MLPKQAYRRIAQSMGRELELALKDDFGIDLGKFEQQLEGGLADKRKPEDFPVDQVCKGVEIELEHTDDPYVALEITIDHLAEHEDYYDRLEEMEAEDE